MILNECSLNYWSNVVCGAFCVFASTLVFEKKRQQPSKSCVTGFHEFNLYFEHLCPESLISPPRLPQPVCLQRVRV